MILIDLQKVFDTTKHKILLDKPLPIGFSKNAINWHESYSAERNFSVEVWSGFQNSKIFHVVPRKVQF